MSIRVGGGPDLGPPGEDAEYCGLIYPNGDEITKHMAQYLQSQPFYMADKLAQALAMVKKRRTAIDCGAWVGGWSRELAKHFEHVLTIEAHPNNARCARKNLAACANVEVLNIALGEQSGMVAIRKLPDGPHLSAQVKFDDDGEFHVEMKPLDSVAAGIAKIDYIKVHVNGMELRALRGAVQTIARHRPFLTVVLKGAIEDYGSTAEEARRFLAIELRYVRAGGERPYELWGPA